MEPVSSLKLRNDSMWRTMTRRAEAACDQHYISTAGSYDGGDDVECEPRRSPRRLSLDDCKAERRLARFGAYRSPRHQRGFGLIALPPVAIVAHRRALRQRLSSGRRSVRLRDSSCANLTSL